MAIYSDLNSISPTKKPLLYDFQSVYQALILLFNTRPGEIAFYPEYGIDLEEELFTVIDDLAAAEIYRKTFEAIKAFEPRVEIDASHSSVTPNEAENRFDVVITFSIVGLGSEQKFEFVGKFNGTKQAA